LRAPIFAKYSNPAIDLPIIKKSIAHCEREVSALLADWVNPADHKAGIICRSMFRRDPHEASLNRIAGSGFDTAWHIQQSGYAGPNVWQLKRQTA